MALCGEKICKRFNQGNNWVDVWFSGIFYLGQHLKAGRMLVIEEEVQNPIALIQ